MTWIERTAYPRLSHQVSMRELVEAFTPTCDEIAWARAQTRSDQHLLTLLVLLKCHQRLGYFPRLAQPAPGRCLARLGLRSLGGRLSNSKVWVFINAAVASSANDSCAIT